MPRRAESQYAISSPDEIGEAEAAKLPDAGISAKPCPRKCAAERGHLPVSLAKIKNVFEMNSMQRGL
jgi:hypothetical protein